ncbi:acetyltransferase [Pseudomonas sp. NBRC 111123]|uniref:acetyltransferase n=1 Tax=Pseudomonas sp. NBRC 111123 TaxID=1661038 RepID=UPI00076130A8|nr:acetyltransferase [Pseudomonas sp. NBRC 111123]
MRRLAILGASGHGKVLADIAELCGWPEVVFYDDAWPARQVNGHWPIVGDSAALLAQLSSVEGVIVGIGNNQVRHDKQRQLAAVDAPIVSLIHPQAVISPRSAIGIGSVVMGGVVVNIDSRIGDGAILNTGCSVDHDNLLGDFVHLSPGARLAGGVTVGDLTWVGIGACIRQMIQVGSRVVIGAGAVVVKPVADGITAVGVPARSLASSS